MSEYETSPVDGGVINPPYADHSTGTYLEPDPVDLPTQVLYPLRTILRTLVQTAIGALCVRLALLLPGAEAALQQLQGPLVEISIIAVTGAVSSGVSWLMSRPGVDKLLTQIGLGAHPSTRSAA